MLDISALYRLKALKTKLNFLSRCFFLFKWRMSVLHGLYNADYVRFQQVLDQRICFCWFLLTGVRIIQAAAHYETSAALYRLLWKPCRCLVGMSAIVSVHIVDLVLCKVQLTLQHLYDVPIRRVVVKIESQIASVRVMQVVNTPICPH